VYSHNMTVELAQVRQIVDQHLGSGIAMRHEEVSYYCPFCNHYKRKLQVNYGTQKWHCWVCDAKGNSIGTLLRKSGASIQVVYDVKRLVGDRRWDSNPKYDRELVSLPEDYQPLHIPQDTPSYRHAIHYAMVERGLTAIDILRYRVGFCDKGPYSGMLIIPSYDSNNKLNFFSGRSFYREVGVHKNPPVLKDIIGFENQINWSEPVVLVEGVFDAIATKRNAIPLFGKIIQPSLKAKITTKSKEVYLALDQDAFKASLAYMEYFINHGITVRHVKLQGKDPSELGYQQMVQALQNAPVVDFGDLIRLKINLNQYVS